MVGLNRVFLIGNLTRDPELRYTPSGTAVASFGLAVNRRYTTKEGERKEEVDFFDIEVWDRQAENCNEYLSKGRAVLVEGRIKQERWEDESGNKRTKYKIVSQSVQFLSRISEDDSKTGGIESAEEEQVEESNLPF